MSAVPLSAAPQLAPGFGDPVHDAQRCFRAILDAMAHPGRVVELPAAPASELPAPLRAGAASVALTLCDLDTPVWLDARTAGASPYLSFHCGCPIVETPAEARFAFARDLGALPPLMSFALGSDEYPDRSATLVLEVGGLVEDSGMRLSGPGIRDAARLGVAGIPHRFWEERALLGELFPRGLDMLFVQGGWLAALPRTTRVAL